MKIPFSNEYYREVLLKHIDSNLFIYSYLTYKNNPALFNEKGQYCEYQNHYEVERYIRVESYQDAIEQIYNILLKENEPVQHLTDDNPFKKFTDRFLKNHTKQFSGNIQLNLLEKEN